MFTLQVDFAMPEATVTNLFAFASISCGLIKVNEVNYLAVSSQRVQISERRLNICKPSKERVGACKDYVIGREITSATALKTAVDNAIL